MTVTGKGIVRKFCPPIVWKGLRSIKSRLSGDQWQTISLEHPSIHGQNLDVYWTEEMRDLLDHWGEDNTWREIQFLLTNCRGRVLDIACGTGRVMEILKNYSDLELYGCDLSDFLIKKAVERGIAAETLRVCDAADTKYDDNYFDYSYSIGTLAHFPEEGIMAVLEEAKRITRRATFHEVTISKGQNEGWISPGQSYFNNGADWWLPKFRSVFPHVSVLPSAWSDERSIGLWFICRCSDS